MHHAGAAEVPMWFTLEHADLSLVDGPAERVAASALCPASPERVFSLLSDVRSWPQWFDGMRDVQWISERTHGEGAVRVANVNLGRFEERILAWEPGARFAFAIDRASLPLARRIVEDWRLTAVEGGTRLDWAMVVEPTALTRFLRPILEPLMARMFRRSAERMRGLLLAELRGA